MPSMGSMANKIVLRHHEPANNAAENMLEIKPNVSWSVLPRDPLKLCISSFLIGSLNLIIPVFDPV